MNAKTRFWIKAAIVATCVITWAIMFAIELTVYLNDGSPMPPQLHADVLIALVAIFLAGVTLLAVERGLERIMIVLGGQRVELKQQFAALHSRLDDRADVTQALHIVRHEVAIGRAPVAQESRSAAVGTGRLPALDSTAVENGRRRPRRRSRRGRGWDSTADAELRGFLAREIDGSQEDV
jgi:hypothetical protein